MTKKLKITLVVVVIAAVAGALGWLAWRYGGEAYTNISQMITFSHTGSTDPYKIRYQDNGSGQRGLPAGGYWFGAIIPNHDTSLRNLFTMWNEGTEKAEIRMQIENCQAPNNFYLSDASGANLGWEVGFLLGARQTIQTGRTIYVLFAPTQSILYRCNLDIYQVKPSGEELLEQVPLSGRGS